jgi:hypothetical protein
LELSNEGGVNEFSNSGQRDTRLWPSFRIENKEYLLEVEVVQKEYRETWQIHSIGTEQKQTIACQ